MAPRRGPFSLGPELIGRAGRQLAGWLLLEDALGGRARKLNGQKGKEKEQEKEGIQ